MTALPQPYEPLSRAPKEIRAAANIALICGAISRAIGILVSTVIIAMLPTWVLGLLALQPLSVGLLVLTIGSFGLSRTGFRARERIAGREFEKARSSSFLATILGFAVGGVVPGILYFFLYTRIGRIMVKRRPDDPPTVYLPPRPSEGIFLGRYLGWLVAYFLVLYIGYTQLPTGLKGISDWLSPALGVHFNTLVVAAYLIFTNPLTYPPLLQLWVTAGLLGGLIAGGRVGRGFLVGLAVFLSTLGAMGLAALSILRTFSIASFANIPPPPPGFSLVSVATGPIAGDLIPIIFRTTFSPTDFTLIRDLVLTLVRNAGLVLALVTISGRAASLLWQGGAYLGKLVLRTGKTRRSPSTEGGAKDARSTVKTGIFFILLALFVPTQQANTLTTILQVSPLGPYQQNLLISLDMLGAPNASLLLENLDLSSRGLVLDSNYDGSDVSMFIINNNHPLALGAGPQPFLPRLFSEPALITFYSGDPVITASKSDAVAAQFSQALGVSFTFALSLPMGQSSATMYSPSPLLSNQDALARVLGLLPASSFASLINATHIQTQRYFAMLGLLPAFNGTSVRAFSFTMGLQWSRVFFKEGPHQLSLKSLMGFQTSISSDANANRSIVTVTFQPGTSLTSYTPVGPETSYNPFTMTLIHNATTTTSPTPDLTANFTFPFAPNVVVQKTVNPTTGTVGSTHTVMLRVENRDTVTVDRLNVTDAQASSAYKNTLQLAPNTLQTIQVLMLPPGNSTSLTYTATSGSSGTYLLSEATAVFMWTAPSDGIARRYSIRTEEPVLTSLSGPRTQFTRTFNDLWPYSLLLLIPLSIPPVLEALKLVGRKSTSKLKPPETHAEPKGVREG